MIKKIFIACLIFLLLLAGGGIFFYIKLRASLPVVEGKIKVSGLELPVTVTADALGIPTITAQNRLDAMRALGFIMARDRLFQMDLIRRAASGRLAEIIGKIALENDIKQREIGFNRVAPLIVNRLPEDQKDILKAYAQGVNAFIQTAKTLPIEFVLLGYKPEPWKPEDSILVVLSMFNDLNGYDKDERMMTVMEKVLPPEVVAFLTPDNDAWAVPLLGGRESYRPIQPIPVEALAKLRKEIHKMGQGEFKPATIPGSNNWVVSGTKTKDGRAIVANDMHLGLSIPNIWYRASLRYENVSLDGVFLPGLPTLVIGSNKHVAWGYTNLTGDLLDLVLVETNPDNLAEYQTPEGWKQFQRVREKIVVRWAKDVEREIKQTIWGPILSQTLLGKPVALHWTALDPEAVNLDLTKMDRADSLDKAIQIMNESGNPPLNAVIADNQGHIAWTLTGKIPIREGFDGTIARAWTTKEMGWKGYIPPHDLPHVVDPPSGYLMTANNRVVGKGYPYPLGFNFGEGFRAWLIGQDLDQKNQLTENDLFQIQLDVNGGFYEFYHQIALNAIMQEKSADKPLLAEIETELRAWDRRADINSRGFGLLVKFREILAKDVFTPFLTRCEKEDKDFSYNWFDLETPLRLLLEKQIPDTNPDPKRYASWNALIVDKLIESANEIKKEAKKTRLEKVAWGFLNRVQIKHSLFGIVPVIGRWFNMPEEPQPGCPNCVRVTLPDFGQSERMVVSPGHEEEGILEMPGGESGHPLSPNYDDQQSAWVGGEPLPLLPGPGAHTMILTP